MCTSMVTRLKIILMEVHMLCFKYLRKGIKKSYQKHGSI